MKAAYVSGQFGASGGWIVGNCDRDLWRTWDATGPAWTPDRDKAIRYARREDAELAYENDEDAWSIVAYAEAETKQ